MTELAVRTPSSRGVLTMADAALGKGGEGAVHRVLSHDLDGLPRAEELVAKIYYKPEEGNRREKVISMVSSPPSSDMFAWPLAVLARNGKFCGYLMRKLDSSTMKEWAHLAHTKTRRELAPNFDVRYALTATLNYAIALQSLHEAGHVQGDINESNEFVGADATVVVVDTDSAQIRATDGRIFRCEVGKPEYTAAELVGKPLREQDRTVATDAFAFGVMLFQMLTGGAHQTDGIYTGSDDPPSTVSKISQGIVPMLRDESARGFRPVPRIAVSGIPSKLRGLILQLSSKSPQQRPSFEIILSTLRSVVASLVQCSVEKNHWYDSADGYCGWCEHANGGQPDPWSNAAPKPTQSSLPPVDFGEKSSPQGKAPRSSINAPRYNSGLPPTAVQKGFRGASGAQPSAQPSAPIPNPSYSPSQQMSPVAQRLAQQAGAPTAPSPKQPSAPAAKIPSKIRGKTTVTYPDGSYGARPPLKALYANNRPLWRESIANEWPDFLRFWWPRNRPLATVLSIWLSPVVAIATLVIFSWTFFNLVLPLVGSSWIELSLLAFMAGILSSATVFVIWWINCWVGRSRAKKTYGEIGRVRHESIVKTLLRAFGIAASYTLTPIVGALWLLFALLSGMVRSDRSSRRYYR